MVAVDREDPLGREQAFLVVLMQTLNRCTTQSTRSERSQVSLERLKPTGNQRTETQNGRGAHLVQIE